MDDFNFIQEISPPPPDILDDFALRFQNARSEMHRIKELISSDQMQLDLIAANLGKTEGALLASEMFLSISDLMVTSGLDQFPQSADYQKSYLDVSNIFKEYHSQLHESQSDLRDYLSSHNTPVKPDAYSAESFAPHPIRKWIWRLATEYDNPAIVDLVKIANTPYRNIPLSEVGTANRKLLKEADELDSLLANWPLQIKEVQLFEEVHEFSKDTVLSTMEN